MPPPSSPALPEFNPDSDPELQAALAEFKNAAESMHTEYQSQTDSAEAAAAAAPSPAEAQSVPPPPDEAQTRAEFNKMEATSFGHETAFQGAELSHQIMHSVENVAEQILEHRHHPEASKELQWFYAEGSKRVGPVSQSQLLQKFERGDLKWSILVWNKKLSEWTKASETELLDLSKGPEPPPLPPPLPSAKKQTLKDQKCKACGRVNGPNDRFCAGCGKPLRSKGQ